jgi:hypothetical protein
VGYLWLKAGIKATATIAGVSRTLDESASTGAITGAVGGYANGWRSPTRASRCSCRSGSEERANS